jgi:DNA-directed RNA polymerase specialized sigma24 family protein
MFIEVNIEKKEAIEDCNLNKIPENGTGENELREKVNQLCEVSKKAIIMHYFEGYKVKEISKHLNRGYESIRKDLSKELMELRNIYEIEKYGLRKKTKK